MIYLFNLILACGYLFIIEKSQLNEYARKKISGLLVCLHAVLFRALVNPYNFKDTSNYAVAFDYISYYSFKEAAFSINDLTGWGQGYVVLNWVVSRFTQEADYLFVILAVLSVIPVVWFYGRTSYSLILTVTLYAIYPMMYLMGFSVVRQHLSIAAMLMALYFVNDYKKSIPLAILSTLFHYSSVIFIPFYFWRKLDFSKMRWKRDLLLFLTGVFAFRILFGSAISFLVLSGVNRYQDFGEESEHGSFTPVLILGSLVMMFYIGKVFKACVGRDSDIAKFLLYGLLVSVFCIGLSGGGRLTISFLYIVPVAVTFLFRYAKINQYLSYGYVILLLLLFTRQFLIMRHNWVMTYEYTFFWE